jgi:hemolysin-activating ACP:hemolysin acyltransferase
MTIDERIERFKSSVGDLGVNGVMIWLTAEVPFFAVWPVKQLMQAFVRKIVTILLDKTELGAFHWYADALTKGQAVAFEQAAMAVEVAKEKGLSDEELAKLEQAKIDACRALIKFTH